MKSDFELITCGCGAVYSQKLSSCPECGVCFRYSKRGKKWGMVRAGRATVYLERVFREKGVVNPDDLFYAVYHKTSSFRGGFSLKLDFIERFIKNLQRGGILDERLMVKYIPDVEKVYESHWVNEDRIRRKIEEVKNLRVVDAYGSGGYVFLQPPGSRKNPTKKVVLLNSLETVDLLAEVANQNPHISYGVDFTNGFRPTMKHFNYLLFKVPNVNMFFCSPYTYMHRLSIKLINLFQIFQMPRGGVKKWTKQVIEYIDILLKDGMKLGTICEGLFKLGIRITVKGLLQWHWKEIRPPPGSTW